MGPAQPPDAKFVGPKEEEAGDASFGERVGRKLSGVAAPEERKGLMEMFHDDRLPEILQMTKEALLTGRKYPEGHEPVDIDARGSQYLLPIGGASRGAIGLIKNGVLSAPEGLMGGAIALENGPVSLSGFRGLQGAESAGLANKEALIEAISSGAGKVRDAAGTAAGLLGRGVGPALRLGKRALPYAIGTATGGVIGRHL